MKGLLGPIKWSAGLLLFSAVVIVTFLVVTPLAQLISPRGSIEIAPASPIPGAVFRFAVIGDYGDGSTNEAHVAALVNSWNPDFIITTGDNNYPSGEASTIDDHIGQFYSAYIGNYIGEYGSGSLSNRFWPSLGNHDWQSMACDDDGCQGPYLDYFTLPGNERYYDVDLGLVHLFALNSDFTEPDGVTVDSIQANWLREELAGSTACFDVVFSHVPPYSSGHHGSGEHMRWSFAAWGADVVLSGHDHTYERIEADGILYFVNGLGGQSRYGFANEGELPPGVTSQARFSREFGAMLVTVTTSSLTTQFYDVAGGLIDQYTLEEACEIGLFRLYVPSVADGTEP
jgi:hypothetical protein